MTKGSLFMNVFKYFMVTLSIPELFSVKSIQK